MESDEDVIGFYDAFVEQQASTGINDRIYGVCERIKNMGLSSHSTVLELGCGIGLMTQLMARKVTHGRIEAIDISEASIQYAQSHFARRNILFKTQDVTEFETAITAPSFVTLIDVLEHIPLKSMRPYSNESQR